MKPEFKNPRKWPAMRSAYHNLCIAWYGFDGEEAYRKSLLKYQEAIIAATQIHECSVADSLHRQLALWTSHSEDAIACTQLIAAGVDLRNGLNYTKYQPYEVSPKH